MFASDFQIIKFYIAQSKRFVFMICFGRISTSKKNRFRLSIPMARQMRWIGKWLRDQIDCVSSNHLSILNDYGFDRCCDTSGNKRKTFYIEAKCVYIFELFLILLSRRLLYWWPNKLVNYSVKHPIPQWDLNKYHTYSAHASPFFPPFRRYTTVLFAINLDHTNCKRFRVCVFWCIVLSIAKRPTRRKKAEQVEPTPSSSISIDSILIFAFENNINQFCYANK